MSAKKAKEPQSLLSLMYRIITIGILLIGVILVFAMSPPANASGCKHNCEKTNTVVVEKDDNDEWKYVVGTAIVTCAAISIYRQTWCWEKSKTDPVPNPGPAPRNDVTPDIQPNRIIFK